MSEKQKEKIGELLDELIDEVDGDEEEKIMTLLDSEKVWVMPLCDIPLEPSYKKSCLF